MVLLVTCGIDLYFSHKKKQLGVEEGITQAFLVNDDTGEKIKINMLKIRRRKSWRKSGRTRGIRMKRKLKFFTYGFYISMVV